MFDDKQTSAPCPLLEGMSVERLLAWLDDRTGDWHRQAPTLPARSCNLGELLEVLHACNFSLWHEEDEARRQDLPDSVIVGHKRAIDRWNQLRNDTIEQIDAYMLAILQQTGVCPGADAEQNSETPGSILDRLSIASLKIYHMAEQTARTDAGEEHIALCRERLATLNEQRSDLALCLHRLLVALLAGRKRLKLYRQFKMYNDPDMNPALYNTRSK